MKALAFILGYLIVSILLMPYPVLSILGLLLFVWGLCIIDEYQS
jgi:hypothetical protein